MTTMYDCKPVDMSFLETAPYRLKSVVEIAASPERIFDAFEDPNSWTVWAIPITNVEWTSPKPFGIGTTRTVTMVGNMVGEEEFIAWDRGKRMAFRFNRSSTNTMPAFAEDYVVEELDPGRCRVTWTMAMEPGGASRVTMPLTAPLLRMGLQYMLGRFKKYVEDPAN
jgi:uncharacterized protein YndB with AHSA1/START domain